MEQAAWRLLEEMQRKVAAAYSGQPTLDCGSALSLTG
jgi:hypothetical protein